MLGQHWRIYAIFLLTLRKWLNMVAKCVYNIWMVLREGTSSKKNGTMACHMSKFANNNGYYNAIWHSFFLSLFFRISILPRASSESAVMSKFDQHYVKSFSKPQLIASKQNRNNTKRHKKWKLSWQFAKILSFFASKRIANQVKGWKRKFRLTKGTICIYRKDGMKFALFFERNTDSHFSVFLWVYFYYYFFLVVPDNAPRIT